MTTEKETLDAINKGIKNWGSSKYEFKSSMSKRILAELEQEGFIVVRQKDIKEVLRVNSLLRMDINNIKRELLIIAEYFGMNKPNIKGFADALIEHIKECIKRARQ